jgi:hypothetical protein
LMADMPLDTLDSMSLKEIHTKAWVHLLKNCHF